MPDKPLYLNKNLQIIFFITLLAVMGVASLTPAFPAIAHHFNIEYKKIGYLITVFTLPGIVLTPVLGILADRFGRKTILVPALFLFAIAGFACSFAISYHQLLIFRFIQGIGAASLGSLNVTLIGDIFSKEERPTAMGYNASVLSLGTAAYPAIGGGLALLGWNFPFYFPLLAIPAGFLVLFVLKNEEPKQDQKILDYFIDTIKSILNWEVLVLFSLNVLTFIILYGSYLTYFPFIMEHRFASTSLAIGIIMSSSAITTALTSSQLGRLNRSYTSSGLLKVSYTFYFISLVTIPFIHNEWLMILPAVFFGAGQGINIPNIQTLLVGLAPMKYRAAFMSLNGMVLRTGQTLGPFVAGVFFSIGGVQYAFWGGAGVAVIMFTLVALTLGRTDARKSRTGPIGKRL